MEGAGGHGAKTASAASFSLWPGASAADSSWRALLLAPAGGSEVLRTAAFCYPPPRHQHTLSRVTILKNWVSRFLRLPFQYWEQEGRQQFLLCNNLMKPIKRPWTYPRIYSADFHLAVYFLPLSSLITPKWGDSPAGRGTVWKLSWCPRRFGLGSREEVMNIYDNIILYKYIVFVAGERSQDHFMPHLNVVLWCRVARLSRSCLPPFLSHPPILWFLS